jgi:hypothetical protein
MEDATLEKKMAGIIKASIYGVVKQTAAEAQAAAEARAAVAKADAASYAKINKLFYHIPPMDTFFYYESSLNCNNSPPVGTWTWSVSEGGQRNHFSILIFSHFDSNGNVSTELLNLRQGGVIKLQAGQGPDAAGNDPNVANYQIWRVVSHIDSYPNTVAYHVKYIHPLGKRYIFPDNQKSLVIVHQPGILLNKNREEIIEEISLDKPAFSVNKVKQKKGFSSRFPDVPDPDLPDSEVQQLLASCSLTCSPRYIFETVLKKKIPLYKFKDKYPIDYLSKYFTSVELKQLYDEYAGQGAYERRRVSIENLVASDPLRAPIGIDKLKLQQLQRGQMTEKIQLMTERQLITEKTQRHNSVSLEFMIDLIRSAENNERKHQRLYSSSPPPPPPTKPSLDDPVKQALWENEYIEYRRKYGDLWDDEMEPYMQQQQNCQCVISGGGRQRKKNIRHNKNIKKKNKSVKKLIKTKKKKSSRKSFTS